MGHLCVSMSVCLGKAYSKLKQVLNELIHCELQITPNDLTKFMFL